MFAISTSSILWKRKMQRRGYHYYFQNLPIRSLHDDKIWEYNKNTNRENKVAKTLENEDWSSEVI